MFLKPQKSKVTLSILFGLTLLNGIAFAGNENGHESSGGGGKFSSKSSIVTCYHAPTKTIVRSIPFVAGLEYKEENDSQFKPCISKMPLKNSLENIDLSFQNEGLDKFESWEKNKEYFFNTIVSVPYVLSQGTWIRRNQRLESTCGSVKLAQQLFISILKPDEGIYIASQLYILEDLKINSLFKVVSFVGHTADTSPEAQHALDWSCSNIDPSSGVMIFGAPITGLDFGYMFR